MKLYHVDMLELLVLFKYSSVRVYNPANLFYHFVNKTKVLCFLKMCKAIIVLYGTDVQTFITSCSNVDEWRDFIRNKFCCKEM